MQHCPPAAPSRHARHHRDSGAYHRSCNVSRPGFVHHLPPLHLSVVVYPSVSSRQCWSGHLAERGHALANWGGPHICAFGSRDTRLCEGPRSFGKMASSCSYASTRVLRWWCFTDGRRRRGSLPRFGSTSRTAAGSSICVSASGVHANSSVVASGCASTSRTAARVVVPSSATGVYAHAHAHPSIVASGCVSTSRTAPGSDSPCLTVGAHAQARPAVIASSCMQSGRGL